MIETENDVVAAGQEAEIDVEEEAEVGIAMTRRKVVNQVDLSGMETNIKYFKSIPKVFFFFLQLIP